MTKRQRKLLSAICYVRSNLKRNPTVDEMAAALEWPRTYVVHDAKALDRDGWVIRKLYEPWALVPVSGQLRKSLRGLQFMADRMDYYPRFQKELRRIIPSLLFEIADKLIMEVA